jgi:type VI secretion system protein ImpE
MNASELYKAGKLKEAIDAQIQQVKANAGDQNKRLFLFELLLFAGDLERARRQSDVLRYDDLKVEAAALAYRKLLESEDKRRNLFKQGLKPGFLLDPPPEHVHQRLEALNLLRDNKSAEAAQLLEQADAAVPPLQGQLNGKRFASLRDCDDLFGPTLEVMGHGNYYWVPLDQVETLAMNPPRFPRDLLWIPARIQMNDGATGDVFLPALYPSSHEHPDDQVKLGRKTEWTEPAAGPVRGLGLREFFVDDDQVSILEWRELQMGADEGEAAPGKT